jgi:malate dehydrogenase (oxaloacetate-decarboxylating)
VSAPGPDRDELLARARKPGEDALRLHPIYRGKMQTTPKCPIRGFEDFAIWYSPGVAAPCRAIQADPELVYTHTNKGNSIAIVTDGTRVLGLGDIGPEAGLPVMEGKAMLFKYLGGVDAVPICLGTKDPEEFIRTVRLLEPAFGGINLEDIAQPKCFRILDALRGTMGIPVWHDDQQGTATGLLAGLLNALLIVGKDLHRARLSPARTPSPKSGRGRPRRPGRGSSPPAGAISRTSSTTPSSSPASSAELSTCGPAASPTAWRLPSHGSWPASP